MKVKYWAAVFLLLLTIGQPARAATGGFQTLAGGAGARLEMRQSHLSALDPARRFVLAPGSSWQPLLMVGTGWPEHYAGVFVKTSDGRLSLLIATLASRHATLTELRLNVRRLLAGLRRPGTIVSYAVTTAADED
jgi:hypothetical protein